MQYLLFFFLTIPVLGSFYFPPTTLLTTINKGIIVNDSTKFIIKIKDI